MVGIKRNKDIILFNNLLENHMKRITLLFLLTCSLLFSEKMEEYPFLGITISTQTTDIVDVSDIDSQTETSIGIRYGRQTIDWRTMFTFEYVSDIYRSFSVEIDKILMDDMFGFPEVRPYAGAVAGAVTYLGGDDEASTYFYGVNAGFIIYATDNIDADLSYHYYRVSDFEELNNLQGVSLSLHYFY
jgi:opacity protein-like surface antigen